MPQADFKNTQRVASVHFTFVNFTDATPSALTLATAGRDARSFEARALAAWATMKFSSATLTELGRYCNRDQSTMSCAARRIEELQALRPDIEEKMEQLRAALTAPNGYASRQGSSNDTLNQPPC